MRISSFNYLMKQGVSAIWTNWLLSFASFCIMLVSLLLVGLSFLMTINIGNMISNVAEQNEVVAVIADGVSYEHIINMETILDDIDNTAEVVLYSKDEAWESLKSELTEEEQALFQYADTNPLPDTYRIQVDDITLLDETASEIAGITGIEEVMLPSAFVDILLSLQSIVNIVSSVLILALVVVSLVIISNATRASVYARRKEINIMKYVGASNAFIRIPFFIEGMFIGLFASAGAFGLTYLCYDAFFELFRDSDLIASILGTDGIIPFNSIMIPIAIGYVAVGMTIGAFGTVFSTRKHLKV